MLCIYEIKKKKTIHPPGKQWNSMKHSIQCEYSINVNQFLNVIFVNVFYLFYCSIYSSFRCCKWANPKAYLKKTSRKCQMPKWIQSNSWVCFPDKLICFFWELYSSTARAQCENMRNVLENLLHLPRGSCLKYERMFLLLHRWMQLESWWRGSVIGYRNGNCR